MKRRGRVSLRTVTPRQQSSSSFTRCRSSWLWLFIFVIIYCVGILVVFPFSESHKSYDHHQHNKERVKSNVFASNVQNVVKPINNNVNSNDAASMVSADGLVLKSAHSFASADDEINANNKNLDERHQVLHALVPELGEPLPVPPNDADFDSKYAINDIRVQSKLIPLYKPWGHKYSCKILCMVVTLWPDRKEKMEMINATYASGCAKLVWVVDEASNPPKSYAGHDFFVIKLTRPQSNLKNMRNIWEKVHTMWSNVYKRELTSEFDWFIKSDDDTFIITENMKGFLQYYDPNYPHYLGHTLRSRWEGENVIFNSGVCYVLSKATILRIGPYISHLPSMHHLAGKSHCVDRQGAGEDPTTSICLAGVGIRAGNTLDHEMRERFLIFRPEDHEKIFREDTWYWKYKPPGVKEGPECCSPYIVCAHNYKDMHSVRKWFPILQEKLNAKKNWDEIPLPPRPRTFVYDSEQVKFKYDDWFNVENPPHGQRIFRGPDKPWQCNRCKIGDPNDPYWTPWWDLSNSTDQK